MFPSLNNKKRPRGIPIRNDQVRDIFRMVYETPGFVTQIQKLQSMSMCQPLEILIDKLPMDMTEELRYLTDSFWMTTAKRMFLYRITLGIVPYFEVPIKGTAHRYPVIPEIQSQGMIYTFEDDDRVQQFEWQWNQQLEFGKLRNNQKKPEIKWLLTGYEPGLDGELKTPIVACLERFRMVYLARKDALYASFHASHPMIFYEDKPPVGGRIENERDNLEKIETAGDREIWGYRTEQELINQGRIHWVRTRELQEQLARAGYINDTILRNRHDGPILESDGDSARDMDRTTFLHNRITLPSDRHYAGELKPNVLLDTEKIAQQLNVDAAEIVGIPIELTQTQSSIHSANQAGIAMVTGETLKAHTSWINVGLTRMFRDIYGETIRKGWDKSFKNGSLRLYPQKRFQNPQNELRYDMELQQDVHIEVRLKCEPRVNEGVVTRLVQTGFMKPKEATRQLAAITGLPENAFQEPPKELLSGASAAEPKTKKTKTDVSE